MNTPAVTVRPDDTLARAARLMAAHHVKRLPVVDAEDRLCGMVSRGDLLKVFLRPDEDIEEEARRTVVSYLFPRHAHAIHVSVRDGIVVLRGPVHDTSVIWVAERRVNGLDGVVAVESPIRASPRTASGPVTTRAGPTASTLQPRLRDSSTWSTSKATSVSVALTGMMAPPALLPGANGPRGGPAGPSPTGAGSVPGDTERAVFDERSGGYEPGVSRACGAGSAGGAAPTPGAGFLRRPG
ncbi:CBS domain-containing protein [Streptomyces collinus]|uniref:CBS domain-containing protein n=1 Tax=Streptomyces collinus TaxID=42684 RepID=UPI0036CB94E2